MQRPALIIHGGAGPRSERDDAARRSACGTALAEAWTVLAAGGNAVDVVTIAVAALEDNPLFNAGVGSSLTSAGTVEMDASIMDGRRLAAGAVGAVATVANPIRLARAVMDDGRHLLLVGPGAEAFARACAMPPLHSDHFITARQRQRWEESKTPRVGGTVGAVAVDVDGRVAAATSTGGMVNKLPGRVGDSAIIGAGTYADDRAGAASSTGHGEAIIRVGLAKAAVDRLRDGAEPGAAAAAVIADLTQQLGAAGGIIVVDRFGRIGCACNTPAMLIGRCSAIGAPLVVDVGKRSEPLAGPSAF